MDIVFELLRIIIPSGLVFAASYLLVKNFLDNERNRRDYEAKRNNQATLTPLRLQAYERVIIFLERINPNMLVVRVNKQGFNVQQLHIELIKAIKSEYEHNLSQQIYMSYGAWELVKNAKEEMLKLVNLSATRLPHDAQGNELAMTILNVAANLGKKMPGDIAIEQIKREVNQVF